MLMRLLIAVAALSWISAAQAAEPLYPLGSRVGVVPPPGMVPSSAFPGFEDKAHHAGLVVTEVPVDTFPSVETQLSAEALKGQGLDLLAREGLKSRDWRGFLIAARQTLSGVTVRKWFLAAAGSDVAAVLTLQVPENEQKFYSDAVVRAALASTAFRPIPVAERLSLLPYAMTDLGGFRVLQTSADGTALLTDGPKDLIAQMEQPFLLISMVLGQTPQPAAYDGFARQIVASVPGTKDLTVASAQPLTLGTQPAYEVMAQAKNEKTGADIDVVQWLRFGGTGYMRILGIAPRKAFAGVLPRMQKIRDGIAPK